VKTGLGKRGGRILEGDGGVSPDQLYQKLGIAKPLETPVREKRGECNLAKEAVVLI